MKKPTSNNSWTEFTVFSTKGKFGELIPKTETVKCIDEVKSTIKEFKITENTLLNTDITKIEKIVKVIEKNKFQSKAPRKDKIELIRKKAFSTYLNYLRVKNNWPSIIYNHRDNMTIYFQSPPKIEKTISLPDPNKNSLIEYERMLPLGVFSTPLTKNTVDQFLGYINKALENHKIKKSEFCRWDLNRTNQFVNTFNLLTHDGSLPDKKKESNYTSALRSFLKYRTYKNTLPEITNKRSTKPKTEMPIIPNRIISVTKPKQKEISYLHLEINDKQKVGLLKYLNTNKIIYKLKS